MSDAATAAVVGWVSGGVFYCQMNTLLLVIILLVE